MDASIANVFTLTLTTNTTLAIKNGQPGVPIYISLLQDATGNKTVAYNGAGGMTIIGPTTTVATVGDSVTCLIVMPLSYTVAIVVSNRKTSNL